MDVFSAEPYRGNPLAVVIDAEGLPADVMQQFANWTNLAETTFLLPPTDPEADYRVRIFTGSEEFPLPAIPPSVRRTPGSRPAASPAGRRAGPGVRGRLGQGQARRRRLAFAAPPLTRSGPVSEAELARVAAGLGMPREALLDASWLVNGPNWIGVLLESAEAVLSVRPDYAAMAGLKVGVIGPHPAGSAVGFEVRTFIPGDAAAEDPVTGSFNAGAAQWLIRSGRAPESYVAAQGTVLGRAGRIHVDAVGDDIWVGGSSVSCIEGFVLL
ncbi:PhzF family phenazine biosynthesis protein [Arthrobacter sp. OVS8]|nr:PhzF family phenazine biosynthesis protein [Arthrobacter sp. OVS8]